MALQGINNFSVGQSPNTNNIKALGYLFGAIMTEGSWNNGCAVTATPTPDGFVNIGVGHIVFGIAQGSALVFHNTASEKLAIPPNPNNDGSVVFNLVYAKLNLKYDLSGLPTATFAVATGGVNTDPVLPEDTTAGIFCVPLCRVAKTYSSTGVVVTSEIITAGNTNNGTIEPIRPISTLGGTVLFLTQTEINAGAFPPGTIIFNTTTNDFMVSDGLTYNLKKYKTLWTLSSPVALGTYTAVSASSGLNTINANYAPVVRTSPATVFDDILSGATGTGSLTIPANSLKVGDVITIKGTLESTFSAVSSLGNVYNYFQTYIRVGSTILNNVSQRTSFISASKKFTSGCFVNGGNSTNTGSIGTLISEFILRGTITAIGANGKIYFEEAGDIPSYNINGNTVTPSASDNLRVLTQQTTINTTINNDIKLDFRVYRSEGSFQPTINLTNLIISKN